MSLRIQLHNLKEIKEALRTIDIASKVTSQKPADFQKRYHSTNEYPQIQNQQLHQETAQITPQTHVNNITEIQQQKVQSTSGPVEAINNNTMTPITLQTTSSDRDKHDNKEIKINEEILKAINPSNMVEALGKFTHLFKEAQQTRPPYQNRQQNYCIKIV